mmetsp:Transcript_132/g.342  ORF Transcript_132/g.342 Transcript_132/m.342 type:complete len:202 (+) Transcript_132:186-791(+)
MPPAARGRRARCPASHCQQPRVAAARRGPLGRCSPRRWCCRCRAAAAAAAAGPCASLSSPASRPSAPACPPSAGRRPPTETLCASRSSRAPQRRPWRPRVLVSLARMPLPPPPHPPPGLLRWGRRTPRCWLQPGTPPARPRGAGTPRHLGGAACCPPPWSLSAFGFQRASKWRGAQPRGWRCWTCARRPPLCAAPLRGRRR